MKLGELYSVMAIIFATNFKGVITRENYDKLHKNWIIVNENLENRKGHELWKNVKNERYEDLIDDFNGLKQAFDIDYFKLISQMDMKLFFEKSRYKPPFSDLKDSNSANMLAFLAAIFKQDTNEKSHILLGLYLTKYFMPSFRALATHLQIHAKTSYYKALGWFLADYCVVIKNSLGLKA